MPIRFVPTTECVNHPITELAYPLRQETLCFEGGDIRVERLVDVEGAIDLVFQWLHERGLPDRNIEKLAPYFGTVWPSALALSEWMAREGARGKLRDRSVLELGCGLGIPGIVAAKHGGRVTLSDSHPDVPRFLERNLSLNDDPAVDYFVADWEHQTKAFATFDYVVASDVLYEKQHADILSQAIHVHAHAQTKVVVTDPGRAYIQRFVHGMNSLGWRDFLQAWTVRRDGKDFDIYLLAFER